MAKGKIAPHLTDAVEHMAKMGYGYWPEKARAELRALLAVQKWARIKHHDLRVPDEKCPLCRALARLDRVSGAREGTP